MRTTKSKFILTYLLLVVGGIVFFTIACNKSKNDKCSSCVPKEFQINELLSINGMDFTLHYSGTITDDNYTYNYASEDESSTALSDLTELCQDFANDKV